MNSKNRNIKFLIIFFCILSILPTMFADGSIHIYDNSIWGLANESSQFCVINYKEGIQNMILSVDLFYLQKI